MKIIDTISVNPGKTALGHVDNPGKSIFRSPVIGAESAHVSNNISKVLFPTLSQGVTEYRKYDVPLRTIFATILIVTGLSLIISPVAIHSVGFAITTLCFGGLLAIGLLTRPVMIGAATFYCICGALSIRAGIPDVSVFSLMFGCLIFGVIGSGKYSCDTLLLQAIRRQKRKENAKKSEDRMGYKAFHHAR